MTHENENENDKINPCYLAYSICATCGGRIAWGLRVCDACFAIERCEYGGCDNVATEICDTCGASLCDDHVIIGDAVMVDGMAIPYTYCRKFACINGQPVGIVPYITCA